VSKPLLVEYYEELGEEGSLTRFQRRVQNRYNEGTLQRMLDNPDAKGRQAALLVLRSLGTMASNRSVAECLYDEDRDVQELAQAALWGIWFRGDKTENNQELQRISRLLAEKRYPEALSRVNALIARAPAFAEAYNQRAILYWQQGEYRKSIEDCHRALRLNPHHFGAQSGLGQSYLRLKRYGEALKAFRRAYQMNPILEGIRESIQTLERMLREQRRRRDDRK
jgi:tetratricopeptide (TPR) repeat protein